MIKGIIFDFDGVLVESLDIKTKAFGKLFEDYGPKVVDEVVTYHKNNMGVSRYDKFRYYYKEILKKPLGEAAFAALCRRFSQLVKEEVAAADYVGGALEFLQNQSHKYDCFICSATPQGEIEEIVKLRKMDIFFKAVYGSPRSKTDIVREIIEGNNFLPSRLAYVGDALSDYRAASDNGVNFIARMDSHNQSILADLDCLRMPDLKGLVALLDSLP